MLAWLLGPSDRIEGETERLSARLLAALTLGHLLATLVAAAAGTILGSHMREKLLLKGSLGWALLVGVVLVVVSYLLVRTGRYRTGLAIYILTTASFPLVAPFIGSAGHEVGLLATAFIPMVLTATLLGQRWLFFVTIALMGIMAAELTQVPWTRRDEMVGFSIVLTMFGSGLLMVLMRRHQEGLERIRAERLRRSEAASRASQDRVRSLLGASRDLVVIVDEKGERRAIFGGVAEFTGYDMSKRAPTAHFDSLHPDDRERVMEDFTELLKHPGRTIREEWRYLHQDGTYRWHEGLITNRLSQEGINGVVVNIRDVTDRKRAEAAVAQSEQRYRMLFETVSDGIFLFSREGRVIEANDAGCRMLGYKRDELLTKHLVDIIPEDSGGHAEEINREVAKRGRQVFVANHRRKDGTIYPVEVAASMTELDGQSVFMGVARDITDRVRAEEERRQLQDQLQHAVKMESVGRLAGGVAHDFNNLLTAILGNADLALHQLRDGGSVEESLMGIRGAALSAVTVTRQLLAFSRKHVIEARPIDVNHLVRDMSRILERLLSEDVRLHAITGPGLGTVLADPGLVEQAIVNLAVNARDAMPSGGELIIETRDVMFDGNAARIHGLAGAGRYVLLSVTDTGTGMSDEVKSHLFEPFFTTKPRGKGTGLGLATTFAAIDQCAGSIEVESEVGKGTTFKIYLPVGASENRAIAAGRVEAAGAPPTGSETVLLVEDDPRVRDMMTQSLRGCGYDAMIAASGEEALAIAVACKGPIHLLLTDVVMPGINGRELADLLHKLHPETHILFTSGYGENIIAHQGKLEAGIDFLGKPYTMDAMARKVREVLDRRS